MILLDTNILIEILKGNEKTVQKVQSFSEELAISSISIMELYYGAINKTELNKLEKFTSLFQIVQLNEKISKTAVQLVKSYAKSHTLDIPDSLIASTCLINDCQLFTYNVKDFRYIEGLKLL